MIEAQLETWSHQGAITTSSSTYEVIRNALRDMNAPFYGRKFDIYLQGSYGNDTNIWKDSDVDIVIELTQTFSSNKMSLPSDQYLAHERDHERANYSLSTFRSEIYTHLAQKFGYLNVIDGTEGWIFRVN